MIARSARALRAFRLRMLCRHVAWPARMTIGRRVRISATGGGRIAIGENLGVADFASIVAKRGSIAIGCGGHIGIGAVIVCREAISIGDDVLIGEYVTIRDQDHVHGRGLITAQAGFATAPIVIGDNVWIGAKATITRGVTIGSNCVIGANAVVTGDIPPNAVALGVPARVRRVAGPAAEPGQGLALCGNGDADRDR